MKITIFDVGHGGCALLEAPSGAKMMIDCGRKTGEWSPSKYLKDRGITHLDALVITNYDEDHAADLVELRKTVSITSLYRNRLVSAEQLKYLKSEDGMRAGIDELCTMIGNYTVSAGQSGYVTTNWGGVTFKSFMNSPKEFDDENNLSLAWFVSFGGFGILFPGDLEEAGWQALLEQPGFTNALAGVDILVASHHGRENGCCDELFDSTGWKPQAVIISDDYIQHGTQEGVAQWYHRRSTGIKVGDGSMSRHVITTRKDGHVIINVNAEGDFTVTTPAYERQRQEKAAIAAGAAVARNPLLGLGMPPATSAFGLWSQLGSQTPPDSKLSALAMLGSLPEPQSLASLVLLDGLEKKKKIG